jgi:hypothetical protein
VSSNAFTRSIGATQYAAIAGHSLRYLRSGRGPLLLLHTLRTQLDYFHKIVPALSDTFEVYALDLHKTEQAITSSCRHPCT